MIAIANALDAAMVVSRAATLVAVVVQAVVRILVALHVAQRAMKLVEADALEVALLKR